MSGPDMDGELVDAMDRVRLPGAPLPPAFARLGFSSKCGQWGTGRVRFDADGLYEPDPDAGERALIVGVCYGGDLVDLAAFRFRDHHAGTRLGIGLALGLDLLDRNRWHPDRVTRVFADVADWMRDPVGGVYVIDLRHIRHIFDRSDVLDCGSPALEARVRRALWTPPHMPRFVSSPAARRAA